jgi:hypothetical protein
LGLQVGFLDFTEQAALTAVQNVQNVTDKPSNLLVNCQDGQQQIPHIFTGEVQKNVSLKMPVSVDFPEKQVDSLYRAYVHSQLASKNGIP